MIDVEGMAKLPFKSWKHISAKMTWVYRRRSLVVPNEIRPYMRQLPPTRDEWVAIRKKVNLRRKQLAAAEKLKAAQAREKVLQRKKEFRTEYMRVYMQKYRLRT